MKKTGNLICSLLLAGSIFFSCGWPGRVRAGVTIGGVEVGGMTYAEAERAVRDVYEVPFVLHSPAGDFMPEISYSDNLSVLVRRAEKGASLMPQMRREWIDAEQDLENVCAKCVREPVNATLSFTADGFSYTKERAGVYCDYAATLAAVRTALRQGKNEAALVTRTWHPDVTEQQLRDRTRLLAAFSTYFDASKTARVHNISLACARIAGVRVESGAEFSFNSVVGERTKANGFLDAAVILNGEFVQGTGGGVCQASTTLMGAALRAGLSVTESHPHSLSVGYVPPSQDAMVSRYSDLKFRNPYAFPVYLLAEVKANRVTFQIYGAPDGRRYEPESYVLSYIDPPPAEVTEGEEDRTVRAEKQGIRSEIYLIVYDAGGRIVRRRLLRRDTYAAVQGVYIVKRSQEEEKTADEQSPDP